MTADHWADSVQMMDGHTVIRCECGWGSSAPTEDAADEAFERHLADVRASRDRAEARLTEEIATPDMRTEL